MDVIKNILSTLDYFTAYQGEYIERNHIYDFIIEKTDYKRYNDTLGKFYIKLASAAIATEIERQEDYGIPSFETDDIFELLVDLDEEDYIWLYHCYIGNIKYLEHHRINEQEYFFGENLKLEYNILVKIFARIITADLNLALSKVKRILSENVDIKEWCDLFSVDYDDDSDVETIKNFVYGVIR